MVQTRLIIKDYDNFMCGDLDLQLNQGDTFTMTADGSKSIKNGIRDVLITIQVLQKTEPQITTTDCCTRKHD